MPPKGWRKRALEAPALPALSSESEERCEGCRYFGYDQPYGHCRRYPQVVKKTPRDGCGEWKPKPLL